MADGLGKTRVGILGAGYIADFHVRAVNALPDATVVGICDLNLAQAERLAAAYSIDGAYSTLDDLLAHQKLDVVHVLLPPDRHFEAGMRLLEHGVHVLFEKPLCTTADDCRRLLEAAKQRRLQVGTSHNFLFAEPYESLRQVIRDGRLGQLDEVEIVWNKFFPQARFGPFSCWALRAPEHIMLELGPHSIAHLLDLSGNVDDIRVEAGRPIDLPGGGKFFQRWTVVAGSGRTRTELRFSLIEGYTEHHIHVRGALASATVDFERNVFQLRRHRPLSLDFDRFAAIASESAEAVRQGSQTLVRYALTKAKLSNAGAPFQSSITRSVRAFYAALPGVLDERHSAEFAARVIELGERIGREARIEAPAPPPKRKTNGAGSAASDVLVTGATGFIGRELVRQLVGAGHRVRIVTRSAGSLPSALETLPLELAVGSLSDPEFLRRSVAGVRHVVHLARSQGNTWQEYERDDIGVTRSLAEACIDAKVERFIYASSIVIYYAGSSAAPITEETPPDPAVLENQVYARAKVFSERMLQELHEQRHLPLVIVRPGIVLGPGGNPCHWGIGMWPHHSVCQTWGPGTTPLPVVLVQDVADAIVRCLKTPGIEGQSFNLVGDAKLTAQEYLDEIERCAGIRLERYVGSSWRFYATDVAKWAIKVVAGYPERTRPSYRATEGRSAAAPFDCTRAKSVLGWRPESERRTLIQEGIDKPVAEFMLSS